MTTDKGVWNLQQVRDKQLQSLWDYTGAGFLYAAGDPSTYGALGLNTEEVAVSSPTQVPGNWKDVGSGGSNATVVIASKADGTGWSWGANSSGQLGTNQGGSPSLKYSSPVQIPGTTWALTSSGASSAWATKTDGTMWAWGYNGHGQVGQNSTSTQRYSSPTQVGSDTTWATDSFDKLGGGTSSCITIKTDGTLWSWGSNEQGVLGINAAHDSHRSSPVQIPGTWSVVSEPEHVTAYAINTSGELFGWGYSGYGQLANNNTANNMSSPVQIPGTTWKYVTAGREFGMATKTDGTLWGFGRNHHGQLGNNNRTYYSSPIQITGTTWDRVFSGSEATWATKTDGTLWSWGYNTEGQLGHNQARAQLHSLSSPVQVGSKTDWTRATMTKWGGFLGITNS